MIGGGELQIPVSRDAFSTNRLHQQHNTTESLPLAPVASSLSYGSAQQQAADNNLDKSCSTLCWHWMSNINDPLSFANKRRDLGLDCAFIPAQQALDYGRWLMPLVFVLPPSVGLLLGWRLYSVWPLHSQPAEL